AGSRHCQLGRCADGGFRARGPLLRATMRVRPLAHQSLALPQFRTMVLRSGQQLFRLQRSTGVIRTLELLDSLNPVGPIGEVAAVVVVDHDILRVLDVMRAGSEEFGSRLTVPARCW